MRQMGTDWGFVRRCQASADQAPKLAHSNEYEFGFVKQGELGLGVAHKSFKVTRINDGGSVDRSNKKLEDNLKLRVGHYITAVNGRQESAKEMTQIMKELVEGDTVTLMVRRP